MEHRWHPRRNFSGNVSLYHAGKLLCTCHIKNVSPDGMLITQANADLYSGICVDVVIDAQFLRYKPIHSKAMVVHNSSQGLGLMYLRGNPLYVLATKVST